MKLATPGMTMDDFVEALAEGSTLVKQTLDGLTPKQPIGFEVGILVTTMLVLMEESEGPQPPVVRRLANIGKDYLAVLRELTTESVVEPVTLATPPSIN